MGSLTRPLQKTFFSKNVQIGSIGVQGWYLAQKIWSGLRLGPMSGGGLMYVFGGPCVSVCECAHWGSFGVESGNFFL